HVFTGNLRASHPQFTLLADPDGVVLGVSNHDLDAGNRTSDGTETGSHVGVTARERVTVIVGPEQGDRRTGLGETVGVDETDPGKRAQCGFEGGQWPTGAAVRQRLQRGYVCLGSVEGVDYHVQHRGYHHRRRGAGAARDVEPSLCIELREVDDAAAGVDVRQDRA